jgi:hypothetical protein
MHRWETQRVEWLEDVSWVCEARGEELRELEGGEENGEGRDGEKKKNCRRQRESEKERGIVN